MNTLQLNELELKLTNIAKMHKAEITKVDEDNITCFVILKCNIPLLADVRIACEEYGVEDYIESSDSWGYIGIDLPKC